MFVEPEIIMYQPEKRKPSARTLFACRVALVALAALGAAALFGTAHAQGAYPKGPAVLYSCHVKDCQMVKTFLTQEGCLSVQRQYPLPKQRGDLEYVCGTLDGRLATPQEMQQAKQHHAPVPAAPAPITHEKLSRDMAVDEGETILLLMCTDIHTGSYRQNRCRPMPHIFYSKQACLDVKSMYQPQDNPTMSISYECVRRLPGWEAVQ